MTEKTDGDYRLYITNDNKKLLLTHLNTNKFLIFDKETTTLTQESIQEDSPIYKQFDVSF